MLIDRIEVTLTPRHYEQYSVLRICLRTMGQEVQFEAQLNESDIETRFDQYFEAARRTLLEGLKKQKDKA